MVDNIIAGYRPPYPVAGDSPDKTAKIDEKTQRGYNEAYKGAMEKKAIVVLQRKDAELISQAKVGEAQIAIQGQNKQAMQAA
jgi:hypothetical protein